jgi:hypothetical protein
MDDTGGGGYQIRSAISFPFSYFILLREDEREYGGVWGE